MDHFGKSGQITLPRTSLHKQHIDVEGKTIIIGFNEPKFKKTSSGSRDAPLNARFITYFLPAVEISRMQPKRSHFLIVSGVNMALDINAENDFQRAIMIANTALKFDFLKTFFSTFFPHDFSLIETIITQDYLRVPRENFLRLWHVIEKKYPHQIEKIKFHLTKFYYPKLFNNSSYETCTADQKQLLSTIDAHDAFIYAIGHLFTFGDVNFEGNYVHNPAGYVSVGGEAESYFNQVRSLAYTIIKEYGEFLFDRKIILKENYKIILTYPEKTPPPYNGMYDNKDNLLEVTYENGRSLTHYETQKKLTGQMEDMYDHLLPKNTYQQFWDEYKPRYLDLKKRYAEAYTISDEW